MKRWLAVTVVLGWAVACGSNESGSDGQAGGATHGGAGASGVGGKATPAGAAGKPAVSGAANAGGVSSAGVAVGGGSAEGGIGDAGGTSDGAAGAEAAAGAGAADPCAGKTCSGHGSCAGGTCSCSAGYDVNADCGSCSAGYTGYPNCHPFPVCNSYENFLTGSVCRDCMPDDVTVCAAKAGGGDSCFCAKKCPGDACPALQAVQGQCLDGTTKLCYLLCALKDAGSSKGCPTGFTCTALDGGSATCIQD